MNARVTIPRAVEHRAPESEPPPWSAHPPRALLPHEPSTFDRAPSLPDAAEVLRAADGEALGKDLCRLLF